ncbi:MAG: hybrid sensor histidine kinase/response regulator [Armatimonadota bacterium]
MTISTENELEFGSFGIEDAEIIAQPGTICVVEDNAVNRVNMVRCLERDGFTVISAVDGAQGLALIRREMPDLVLLDLFMPGLDGRQVLECMKNDPHLQHIPVIVVSSVAEVDTVVQCIALGADDYMVKPCDPVLLRVRIETQITRKLSHDNEMALQAQLQESYEQLRALEQYKDDLTHMLVHDLRTPLTSILSGLMTMEGLGELNELQQEMLTMGIQGGQVLLDMINDLLDISKMEDGSLKLSREPLEPEGMAALALQQVRALAAGKELQLIADVEPGLPVIRADRDKLARTLVNLLGNACKFTPDGGTITFAIRALDNAVRFSVSDTGEGIPAESFERIFDKFGQVETRKAGHKHSTGLGLTFCKMIVELHGGRIWVESELGQGSTFFFTLPLTA